MQVLGALHQSSTDDVATRAFLHRHHHTQHQRPPVQDPQSGYKRNSPVARADNGKRCTNCAKSVTVSRKMKTTRGSWGGSVVTAPDTCSNGPGFESPQERRESFLLQGQLSVLTLISVTVPPPCYCSKRSRSFCQKCRWQVTAKHAHTLRMWLCMK